MPDLLVGSRNPLFYDFLRVLAPFVEPFLQRRYGRRQDENTDRFREKPSDLMGALPVDFQNGVITFIQLVQYCDTGSPVKVSVNFCMFKKLAFVKWYSRPFCSPGRGCRVVCDTDRRRLESA